MKYLISLFTFVFIMAAGLFINWYSGNNILERNPSNAFALVVTLIIAIWLGSGPLIFMDDKK